jgi:hypothetical protein
VAGLRPEASSAHDRRGSALPLGPALGALLVTGFVASAVSTVIVAMISPLARFGGGGVTTTRFVLALYIAPVVLSLFMGAVLLPPLLRELADFRITAGGAAVAVAGGALAGDALRYAFVEVALGGSGRYGVPAPTSVTNALFLTWLTSVAGFAVSVQLIRRYATPMNRSGAFSYGGYAPRAVAPGVGVIGVVVLGIVTVFALSTRHRIQTAADGIRTAADAAARHSANPVARVQPRSVLASELANVQAQVFDVFNMVATGPAAAMPTVLRLDYDNLQAQTYYLATATAPSSRMVRAKRQLARGVDAFTQSLPRIANLATTSAQQHALVRAPGLRGTYVALRLLQAELDRFRVPGKHFFDQRQWQTILRGR